ncbi:MAG: methyl-accepting chemotaxis protein [Candidatus Kapaibacterium sp.]|nr:MAG: methyl-accepting chemotaxis protein [Candidatus Kapabacteria bacterium]
MFAKVVIFSLKTLLIFKYGYLNAIVLQYTISFLYFSIMNTRPSSLFARQVQRFLPENFYSLEAEERRKTYLTAQIWFILVLLVVPYTPIYILFNVPQLSIITGGTGIVYLSLLLLLRRGVASLIIATSGLITVNLVLLGILFFTGGPSSPGLVSMTIIPLMALLMTSQRISIVFSMVVIVEFAIIWLIELQGYSFVSVLPSGFQPYFLIAVFPPVVMVITVIALMFERNRIETLAALAGEKSSVERKVEESREELRQEQEEARRRDAENLHQAQAQQAYLEESARQILDAMQRFAFGDLTVQVQSPEREDDIAKIFTGFNRSVSSVRELVQEVIRNVEQTNMIAAHISSASGQMAATSQEQASQVTQIASAVEEMARSVSENAHHSSQVSHITQQNGMNATKGANVVDAAVKKIEEIASVVNGASMVVEKLGNSSAEIGEIVQVIEEIADQTNLLALNAAIEAARAGEQGRGFAVVADEVRKLAERTATATKQISQTIKQIQRDTNQAVTGMKRGDNEVREGLTLAKQAGTALTGIVSGSREVESMVQGSANAMQQQSSTAAEIAQSVEQVSSSVNETTASLTEIARATENLRGLTEGLQDLVSRFDVGESSGGRVLSGGAKRRQIA